MEPEQLLQFILNNWNRVREKKRTRKLVATLKTVKRQYKHSQQHRHNHQHENDNTSNDLRWETLKIEEKWQTVQKGKKSNSNKLLKKKPCYVNISNAYSTLAPFIDPCTTTNNTDNNAASQSQNDQQHEMEVLIKQCSASNSYQRKVARRILVKQQTKDKAKNEDAYIDYHVQWAEDERQTIAKKNNNKLGLWKQVLGKTPQRKVTGIIAKRQKQILLH